MSSFTLIALTACAVAQFDPNFDPEGQHVQQHVREFEQIQQIYRQELMRDAAWVVDKSGGASIDRLYIAANGIAKSEMRKPRREIRGLAEDYAAHGLYGELGREINNAKAMVPRRHEVMRSELWKRTVEKSLSPAQRQTLYQARADRLVTRFLSELSTVNLTDAQTKTIRQHALQWALDQKFVCQPEPLAIWPAMQDVLADALTAAQIEILENSTTLWIDGKPVHEGPVSLPAGRPLHIFATVRNFQVRSALLCQFQNSKDSIYGGIFVRPVKTAADRFGTIVALEGGFDRTAVVSPIKDAKITLFDPLRGNNNEPAFVKREGCTLVRQGEDASPAAFVGTPQFMITKLVENARVPEVRVSRRGTVLSFYSRDGIRVIRSIDGGALWEQPIVVAAHGDQPENVFIRHSAGHMSLLTGDSDQTTYFAFYSSTDDGWYWKPQSNWNKEAVKFKDMEITHFGATELRITMKSGRQRYLQSVHGYRKRGEERQEPQLFGTFLSSDDYGKTWTNADPITEAGVRYFSMVELTDGRIYVNAAPESSFAGDTKHRRYTYSHDHGETVGDWQAAAALPNLSNANEDYLRVGLIRLPVSDRDILLFSHPLKDSAIAVWASFDGGKSWPVRRTVGDVAASNSSLAAGKRNTFSDGWIYLQFQSAPGSNIHAARFNLSWLLEGELTGDGEVPAWIESSRADAAPRR